MGLVCINIIRFINLITCTVHYFKWVPTVHQGLFLSDVAVRRLHTFVKYVQLFLVVKEWGNLCLLILWNAVDSDVVEQLLVLQWVMAALPKRFQCWAAHFWLILVVFGTIKEQLWVLLRFTLLFEPVSNYRFLMLDWKLEWTLVNSLG